jgi:hypothetical protein
MLPVLSCLKILGLLFPFPANRGGSVGTHDDSGLFIRFFTNAATGRACTLPPVIIVSKMPYSPCWHEVHSF